MRSLSNRLDYIEPRIMAQSGLIENSIYGIVDRVDKINGELVPNFVRRWKGTIGNMKKTSEDPTIFLIEKLEPLILKHKKVKGAFGGRAGTKSIAAMDIMAGEVNSNGSGVFCLRERMKSLSQSIYKGINGRIKTIGLSGFNAVESRWKIDHKNGGIISFGGMMNVEDMKSLFLYKYFLLEEAANTSQEALDILGPTLRGVEGAEIWLLWNAKSSQDAMSQEFIIPYQEYYDKNGYYEDEYHLIIKVGYRDNPWFKWDESLTQELAKDKSKVKRGIMSKSRFDWIWEGKYNDDVSGSVITEDWFNACIDAHIKLGITPMGAKVAACDPSDTGGDPCGYAARQGIVFEDVTEIEAENGNRKMDEACKRAITYGADSFGYDADGLGATLRDNVDKSFNGKATQIYAYKGSTSIHDPKAEFKSETAQLTNRKDRLLNEDVLYNKKSQNTIGIAEAIFRTWEAVVEGKYHDPETLISFMAYDPETGRGIMPNMLEKLKAEACKTPIKAGDTIRFYTKVELRKGIILTDGSRLKIPSPNLFDACIVARDKDSSIIKRTPKVKMKFTSIY